MYVLYYVCIIICRCLVDVVFLLGVGWDGVYVVQLVVFSINLKIQMTRPNFSPMSQPVRVMHLTPLLGTLTRS